MFGLKKNMKEDIYGCVIIGAGASGIGTGVLLHELGVENYLIIDQGKVGNSFSQWTKETKFISPSFTSNMFFIPDLNAVTPLTSPAFSFNKEHVSGEEYAEYLNNIADHYALNIQENVKIINIKKEKNLFILTNNEEIIYTKHLIWAGGEWAFPKQLFNNTLHTSSIKTYYDLKDDQYVVIGSGESGTDFAYNLLNLGKKVLMISQNDQSADNNDDDPSKKLSPVTIEKFNKISKDVNFKIIKNSKVNEVIKEGNTFNLILENGETIISYNAPYEATGFKRVPDLISELVEVENNDLEISDLDESKKVKNLFFVGPNLHRQNVILCFIYKFRMRFAPVACEVANRLKVSKSKIDKVKKFYKKYNMYLEDIQSCDINCEC